MRRRRPHHRRLRVHAALRAGQVRCRAGRRVRDLGGRRVRLRLARRPCPRARRCGRSTRCPRGTCCTRRTRGTTRITSASSRRWLAIATSTARSRRWCSREWARRARPVWRARSSAMGSKGWFACSAMCRATTCRPSTPAPPASSFPRCSRDSVFRWSRRCSSDARSPRPTSRASRRSSATPAIALRSSGPGGHLPRPRRDPPRSRAGGGAPPPRPCPGRAVLARRGRPR